MDRWMALVAVSVLLAGLVGMSAGFTSSTSQPDTGPPLPYGKYLIMYPKSMRAGQPFSLTIQVFDLVKNLAVTASLTKPGSKTPSITDEVLFKKGTHSGSIELKIPEADDVTSYTLNLNGESKEDDGHPVEKGLTFKEEKSIKLNGKGVSVFIQTDKAIYKPSQTVHFRAMAVYPSLKPYLGALDIDLIDAEGNKIKQYKNITNPGHNGVITKELQLSDQPVLGDWKINIKALGINQTKTFTVAEYVLPKFKVTINAPSFFYYMNSVLNLNIGAKYTYGKKVKGVAEIVVQLKYESHELNGREPPQYKITVQDFDGSTTLKLTGRELLELVLPKSYTFDPVDVFKSKTILVSANVTEGVSGITRSDNAEIQVKTHRHELKFLSATPSSFKPGLTYIGFVKLSQMDGSPPLPSDLVKRNGEVRTVQMVFTGWSYKRERLQESFPIQPSGLVRFTIRIPEDFVSIDMTATFGFVTTRKYGIHKFKSKGDVGIQVSLVGLENGGAVKPNEVTPFKVKSTEEIDSFNLVVLSKGMLITSQHIQVDTASRENTVDITFNSSIAQKLSPSARVIVWYMTDKNEVITDSLDFNVEGVFSNEVSLSFDKNKTRPGESLSLKVTADAASYVGLLAVDQSVLHLKGGNDITQQDVIQELKTYDSKDSGRVDPMPMFVRCMFCGWPIFSGGSDSIGVFNSAGVYVATNALLFTEPPPREHTTTPPMTTTEMMTMPTMTMGSTPMTTTTTATTARRTSEGDSTKSLAKPTVTRSLFPETWLWSDVITGEDGKITIEVKAPHTITSWVATAFAMHRESGLGISPTSSKLTVFQPFFVSLNLPYSIIRGEEFGLQAMIFNYLPEAVEVKVTLSESDSFKVRSADDLTNTVSKEVIVWVIVPPNEAQSAWFWIVPGQLGNIPIEVKAQSHLAADAVRRMLLIEPEGTPQEYSKAVIVDFSNKEGSLSETINITYPPDLVNGSEYISVTAIGDLMGTSIQGFESLIRMPFGCGEQNMLNFAPAIYILDYLVATDQVTPKVKDKALKVMETGYMKELTYQHKDGSFSAFGDYDRSGSMWLSAFVAKSFHQAKNYIFIDTALVEKTLNWIIKRQNANGSFSEPPGGRVIHSAMQGGSSKGLPLTAYVLITLVENNDVTGSLKTKLDNAIASAMAHLEGELDGIDPYALAIVTYALTVSKSSKAAEALQKLNAIAINKGGMMHWKVGDVPDPDPSVPVWRRPYHQAGPSNIEMTSYGLLVYTAEKNTLGGIPILKWLASQRNPNGGFTSTQDTVLAIQAMAELSAMVSGGDSLNLNISLNAGGVDYNYDTITKDNSGILQSKQLPGNTNEVVVLANGKGLGVVQVAVSYNVDNADNRPGVLVDIATEDKGNGITKIIACGKFMKKEESGMTVMEVGLITGNHADIDELVRQVPTLKRVETKDRKVILYFDKFTEKKTCVEFTSQQDLPVTNPRKARVEGYLYYSPDVKDTKYYLPVALENIDMCSACPACCDNSTSIGDKSDQSSESTTSSGTDKGDTSGAICVISYFMTLCLSAIVWHLLVL